MSSEIENTSIEIDKSQVNRLDTSAIHFIPPPPPSKKKEMNDDDVEWKGEQDPRASARTKRKMKREQERQ